MKIIRINDKDNVAVTLENLEKGSVISNGELVIKDDIPRGHKVALCDIEKNSPVVKYGYKIGKAKSPIKMGQHVHLHNLETALGGESEKYSYNSGTRHPNSGYTPQAKHFNGFMRSNGKAGTRNEIWIIPTVGCVNGVAKSLEKTAQKLIHGSINAAYAFTHPYGCSQLGTDQENTRKILAGLINHPNAGGVLVIGLGCENSGIEILKKYIGDYDEERVKFLNAQDFENELIEGEKLISEIIKKAAKDIRTEIPLSELVVGLKCGGSDGFSGITANPVVGVFSDLHIGQGGSTILTEVPEMFGAEQILMDRAKDREIFNKTVELINDFKDYYKTAGVPVYENPSPGNKDGGISTLEDKSLGCTQKSGNAQVCGIIKYGEQIRERGLNLLSAPGNDLVASTALAAAGAQIVLFTTGRGTPFGCPVPTVKISSGSVLANKKSNWIDFDAGCVIDGVSIEDTGISLYDFVVGIASGTPLKSEEMGYNEIAIFKTGVTL